ncbi:MAG: chemotaxis protein CheX [Candidatus Omnitrophica bacterium]|nr:chemotaxis protein CheX [Candidatus Omnitrophota bacterium]
MAKEFDKQVLSTTIIRVVEDTFKKMLRIEPTASPVAAEKDIIEFDGRMRVFPMEKFNGPVYVAFTNFYLSDNDLKNDQALGTFVLFVKEEVVEKLFKAFGRSSKDAEDEENLMDIVGEFCNILSGNFKNELVALGYKDLLMSTPFKSRNSVPDGVAFDYELFQKQEFSFTFWNQKCIVVEACIGDVPLKS